MKILVIQSTVLCWLLGINHLISLSTNFSYDYIIHILGIFIKNIPICICFGISIGMLVGMGIGATIKKNGNK